MDNYVKKKIKSFLYFLQSHEERFVYYLRRLLNKNIEDCHVIVCGYPRSGTSLFYNMLATSLEGFDFIKYELSAKHNIWKNGSFATKCPHDAIKLSRNIIQSVNKLNKKIIAIIIIRDLRDIMTSKHMFAPDEYMIGYDDETITVNGKYPNYVTKREGPGIRSYYNAINDLIENHSVSCVVIKYEDLISDPESCQLEIAEKFGLNFSSKFSDYWKKKEKHKITYDNEKRPLSDALHKSSSQVSNSYVDRWKEDGYKKRIVEQFSNHKELFDMLITYGYEENSDWFATYIDDCEN